MSCAGSPTARISERRLDGPRPPQAIIRCVTDGLKPPIKIAWKLEPSVKQIGWAVPSDDEESLLVQVLERDAARAGVWAQCTATGSDGVVVSAERSLNPPLLTTAPVKARAGDKITVRGSGFGPVRGSEDAIYLVPAWGAAHALDHACKGAEWSESTITACLPPSLPLGSLELRVQAGGELARAATPIVIAPAPASAAAAPPAAAR